MLLLLLLFLFPRRFIASLLFTAFVVCQWCVLLWLKLKLWLLSARAVFKRCSCSVVKWLFCVKHLKIKIYIRSKLKSKRRWAHTHTYAHSVCLLNAARPYIVHSFASRFKWSGAVSAAGSQYLHRLRATIWILAVFLKLEIEFGFLDSVSGAWNIDICAFDACAREWNWKKETNRRTVSGCH